MREGVGDTLGDTVDGETVGNTVVGEVVGDTVRGDAVREGCTVSVLRPHAHEPRAAGG